MKCLAETDIVLDVQSFLAGSPSPKVGEERQETADPCPTSAQRTPAAVGVLAARVASTIRFSSDIEVFGLDLHPSYLHPICWPEGGFRWAALFYASFFMGAKDSLDPDHLVFGEGMSDRRGDCQGLICSLSLFYQLLTGFFLIWSLF